MTRYGRIGLDGKGLDGKGQDEKGQDMLAWDKNDMSLKEYCHYEDMIMYIVTHLNVHYSAHLLEMSKYNLIYMD